MNPRLVRFAVALSLMLAGCNGDCLAILAACGLNVDVSGLAEQETVTVSVRADRAVDVHTFTCTAEAGRCRHFFPDFVPSKVTVQVTRNGITSARTVETSMRDNRAGCSTCTMATANVTL